MRLDSFNSQIHAPETQAVQQSNIVVIFFKSFWRAETEYQDVFATKSTTKSNGIQFQSICIWITTNRRNNGREQNKFKVQNLLFERTLINDSKPSFSKVFFFLTRHYKQITSFSYCSTVFHRISDSTRAINYIDDSRSILWQRWQLFRH